MQFVINSLENKQAALDYIGKMNTAEKWAVTVAPFKKRRSNNQNRLYWAWIRILGTHFGMEDDELHEVIAGKFLGYKEMFFMGEYRIIRKSSASLTTAQFKEYMDMVFSLALAEGIALPHDFD